MYKRARPASAPASHRVEVWDGLAAAPRRPRRIETMSVLRAAMKHAMIPS
jgi:hypothetical protein